MRPRPTFAWLCAAAALLAARVQAQEIALTGAAAEEKQLEGHAPGIYCGVKPGGDEQPAIDAKPGARPASITWPGFQMQPDGSSRVFIQTTAPIDVSAALVGSKVMVDFGSATVKGSNNRRPLNTKFFNTPVTEMELKRVNKRTVLELTLRKPVEPRISSEQAKSGFYFVYVDFPAGNYLPKSEQPVPATILPPPNPPAPEGTLEGGASGQVRASGQVKASASANASMDAELPPGMGKTKAKAKAGGKAKGKLKLGF